MNNFELIDNYLTNRLEESEKVAFEKQLASDPSLKADVEFQKSILEGVKNARTAELKAMLQKIPLGGIAPFDFPMLRMAAAIVGAGLLLTALTFYFRNGAAPKMATSIEDSINKKIDSNDYELLEEPIAPAIENKNEKEVQKVEVKKSDLKDEVSKTVKSPKIEAVDPSVEMIDNSSSKISSGKEMGKSVITNSHIGVDIDSSNKKYSFHYQFNKEKLILYGPFDKTLYEILELTGETHSVFMYYKNAYYILDETKSTVTLLVPIKDKALIAKLSEYKDK
jgi:hypothetical protein